MPEDELADTFGEDFAENVQQKAAERRQERNSVDEEQMAKICSAAINDSKFDEGEPQFTYTTENGITHTVLLMQLPDPENSEVWEYLDEPWEGGAKLPFDYLGEWYWCTFPDKTVLKKVDQGDWCIIVGSIDEYENESGETSYSVYPVRGMATLEEAKEYASKSLDEEGFSEEPQEEEQKVEEDTSVDEDDESDSSPSFGSSSDDSSSSSGGGLNSIIDEEESSSEDDDDEDEPVPFDEVAELVETFADKQNDGEEPQVYDLTEEHDELDKITDLIVDRIGYDDDPENVKSTALDVIEGHRNSDIEEGEGEDDDMDKLF